jgi:hypothetical protein
MVRRGERRGESRRFDLDTTELIGGQPPPRVCVEDFVQALTDAPHKQPSEIWSFDIHENKIA